MDSWVESTSCSCAMNNLLTLFHLNLYPEVGLLDHMVAPFSIVFRNLQIGFRGGLQVYIFTNNV